MYDILSNIASFDDYTCVIIGVFVCASVLLVREIVSSTGLALFSAPILLIGSIAANYLFRTKFIYATFDKDTNVVIATAVGLVSAMVLLLISIWISVLISERGSTRKKLMQLPDVPPAT
jgi:ABC-type Mn2+/Zn2+ transport system permease subunit